MINDFQRGIEVLTTTLGAAVVKALAGLYDDLADALMVATLVLSVLLLLTVFS